MLQKRKGYTTTLKLVSSEVNRPAPAVQDHHLGANNDAVGRSGQAVLHVDRAVDASGLGLQRQT